MWKAQTQKGMSLRDWFAGQALTLFNFNEADVKAWNQGASPQHERVANFCYNLSDALLAERAK